MLTLSTTGIRSPPKVVASLIFLQEKNKEVESIKDENLSLNKAFNTLDKYTDYLIVLVFVCLIWIKFINIYFSSNLAENIDSFVNVYNHIKNNSFFCFLFTFKNELKKDNSDGVIHKPENSKIIKTHKK